jgi:copper transport protein
VSDIGRTTDAGSRRTPGAITGSLAAAVVIALLLPTTPAQAHAVLVRADPSDGAVLALAPSAVRLAFNEPVSAIGPGLRVFNVDGTRVDLARPPERADVDSADRSVLAVALPTDLPDGGYVVAWRVRSTDGHAVSGTLRFTVGDAPPVSAEVAAALADTDAPTWLRALDRTARGAMLIGLLLAAGVAVAGLVVARTTAQRRDAARVTSAAAATTLLLVPAALWLQGAVRAGGTGWAGVSGALAGGAELPAATLRAVGLALLVALARRALTPAALHDPSHARSPLVILAAALALLPLATEGHQRGVTGAGSLRALLPGLDAVHVSAGALWLGAVVLLALAVSSRAEAPNDAEALAGRVGRTALAALAVVALAGSAQAALLVDSVTSLITTAYGATLSAKVVLVVTAVAAAGAARRRARRSGGWQGARALLRTEVALLVSTVAITGALVTLAPPVDADATLFTTSAPIGDALLLDVGVDSGRPGRTELHLYVVEDGALTGRDLDVRATLTSVADGLGPLRIAPLLVEPGHWFAALDPLPPGDWTLEVTVGLDRFTERTTILTVPLR